MAICIAIFSNLPLLLQTFTLILACTLEAGEIFHDQRDRTLAVSASRRNASGYVNYRPRPCDLASLAMEHELIGFQHALEH